MDEFIVLGKGKSFLEEYAKRNDRLEAQTGQLEIRRH